MKFRIVYQNVFVSFVQILTGWLSHRNTVVCKSYKTDTDSWSPAWSCFGFGSLQFNRNMCQKFVSQCKGSERTSPNAVSEEAGPSSLPNHGVDCCVCFHSMFQTLKNVSNVSSRIFMNLRRSSCPCVVAFKFFRLFCELFFFIGGENRHVTNLLQCPCLLVHNLSQQCIKCLDCCNFDVDHFL